MELRETIREVLERALTRIETTGWTKNALGAPEGPNCLLGAIFFSATTDNRLPAYRALAAVLPSNGMCVAEQRVIKFNDQQCGSAENAAEVLRKAIKSMTG